MPENLLTQTEARAEASRRNATWDIAGTGVCYVAHPVPWDAWGGTERGWAVDLVDAGPRIAALGPPEAEWEHPAVGRAGLFTSSRAVYRPEDLLAEVTTLLDHYAESEGHVYEVEPASRPANAVYVTVIDASGAAARLLLTVRAA